MNKLNLIPQNRELTKAEMIVQIRDAIVGELEAIQQYETIVDAFSRTKNITPEIVKAQQVLKDIANEEIVHVGELYQVLFLLAPDEPMLMEKGRTEVLEMLKNK